MAPSQHEIFRESREDASQSRGNPQRRTEAMARSAGIPPRLRNDESWVEISSQPSSSSLSSLGDEIVTTGLRVHHVSNTRRRRRAQPGASHPLQTGTSSQEEYEESESEEDQVMTSSNEHIAQSTRITETRPEYDAESESDSDDDENATALGRRTDPGPAFTPQPNAFSHPPSSHRHTSAPDSYFPPHASNHTRPSYPPARGMSRQHSSYSNHADHDAALRASLTTLLSIGAAAARGLPKREGREVNAMSNQPVGLSFVPESELMGPPAANSSKPLTPSTRAKSSPSISGAEAGDKGKRKASIAKPAGEKTRALKKKRTQGLEVEYEYGLLSPTVLTWVVSAGVVVLVSVVGFGAGYVIGREVGRQETMAFSNGTLVDAGSCGREAVRGGTGSLRRFKWGIGGGSRGIVA